MQFGQVIGQQDIKNKLTASVKLDRVSHAQMLLGPMGHGGLPLALAYAQYLNCENPTETDSCGVCGSCVKAQKFVHPDIHFSFPFPNLNKNKLAAEFLTEWREALMEDPYLEKNDWMLKLGAEKKQANIPITECHEIIRKLNLKTFEGGYKILILWLPEHLGKEGNALLKIIEEPPANTIFLLVAESLDLILDTIISRTQILKIPYIAPDELTQALAEQENMDTEHAAWLSQLASGNYNTARQLHQNAANEHTNMFNAWMRLLLMQNTDRGQLLAWVDQFAGWGRETQKHYFLYIMHHLRELIQSKIRKQASPVLTPDEQALHPEIANRLNMARLQAVYDLFNEGHYYIERNANPKILMLSMSIRLNKLLNGNTIDKRTTVTAR